MQRMADDWTVFTKATMCMAVCKFDSDRSSSREQCKNLQRKPCYLCLAEISMYTFKNNSEVCRQAQWDDLGGSEDFADDRNIVGGPIHGERKACHESAFKSNKFVLIALCLVYRWLCRTCSSM